MKESSKHRANVPNLRFPGNKKDWTTKNLGELLDFKITNSFSRDKLNYDKGTVKNIHYGDIHKKFQTLLDINFEEVPFINEDITLHKISNESYCKEGDIIFADASEDLNDVGKSIEILNLNCEKLLAGLHTLQGRPKPNNFHKGFLGYLLKSNRVRSQIKKEAQGTKVLSINVGRISRINISFPSLVEQKKITDLFFKINQRIQTQNKIIEDLIVLKYSLSKKIFQQQLKFPEFKEKWRTRKLGEVCKIIGGGTPNTHTEEYWNGNIQWFTPTEIKTNFVSQSDRTISQLGLKKSSARILPKGTILLTTRATIGEVAIALEECTTNQGFQSLIVKNNYNNIFILNWIKMNRHELIRRANGSTFSEISKSEIQKIQIEVPILPEQQKIASTLSAIDKKIELENKILEKFMTQKKYFLQNLFI